MSNYKYKILIADDSDFNRAILAEMLGDEYEILEAENGTEAIDILCRESDIDLLLLDIVMPEMDGFEVLTAMNKRHWIEDLPVIMISSENASSYVERAYDLGATDYISRPFDTAVVRRRVTNTLMLYAKQKRLMQMIAEQVYEKEKSNSTMINILSHIVEFRNGESGLHVLHIHTITDLLLRQLVRKTDRYSLTPADISQICMASSLHDIGKISIPESILNKPRKLTPEEYELMKTHTTVGADILREQPDFENEPLLKTAYNICRWHHERYDGKGYPDGLSGEAIPIEAQVVSLADVYDALTSVRCYKPAYDHKTSIEMILRGECGTFNPLLLDCLVELGDTLPEMIEKAAKDDYVQESQIISNEALKDEVSGHNRTQHLLELEQAKNAFFSSHSRDIQFEYNSMNKTVSLSKSDAEKLHCAPSFFLPKHTSLLSPKTLERLQDAIHKTTPDSPQLSMDLLMFVGGEYRWNRAELQTVWSQDTPPQYLGVIGQLADIHDYVIHHATFPHEQGVETNHKMLALIKELQKIFDAVRLVDPKDTAVLELTPNGHLIKNGHYCYALWGRSCRCENCVSCCALERKKQVSKLEFAGNDTYQVLARYVEIDEQPCVLEMVSKLSNNTELSLGKEALIQRLESNQRRLYIDPLTGAYNRRYLEEQQLSIERFEGVAMIDADNFKMINDTYGHLAGDAAIHGIAAAILSCIRRTDILLRYGGDEFLLLFPRIPSGSFKRKLEQIRASVSRIRLSKYPQIQLSISIGGVKGIHPLGEAIRQSDDLMYKAKEQKNSVQIKDKTDNIGRLLEIEKNNSAHTSIEGDSK